MSDAQNGWSVIDAEDAGREEVHAWRCRRGPSDYAPAPSTGQLLLFLRDTSPLHWYAQIPACGSVALLYMTP